jgi:hypothetical protein
LIIRKIYKHRKIFAAVVVVGVLSYVVTNLYLGNHIDPEQVHHTYTGLNYVKDSQVIDKDLIIKSLSKTQQLVGMEGHATKTYIYTDSIFKEHNWLKDALGQRSLEVTVDAIFKTGINLSDIKDSDLVAYGSTLYFKVPKHVLISLDVPFNEIIFKAKNGLIRSDLSLEEKQFLYTEIRKIITNNIMSDETIKNNTYAGVKDALQNLISKVPNVGKIVFSPRME